VDWLYSIDFAQVIKDSQYTGLIIFTIAFLETLLFVGFMFPGSVALIAIGGLIATGYLDLWSTLAWAFAGAVVGDNISFWIGVYFQEPLKRSRLYQQHLDAFHKGEAFFQKYGSYSVAIGRFVGPIRAVIPAIAGSMGMSGRKFFIVNVVSALFWAPAYILPGMFFGDILKRLKEYVHIEFWSLSIIIVLIAIVYFLIRRSRKLNNQLAYIGLSILSILSLGFTQITFPV
jgi:membrane protein DedA with SNARE-associated domain